MIYLCVIKKKLQFSLNYVLLSCMLKNYALCDTISCHYQRIKSLYGGVLIGKGNQKSFNQLGANIESKTNEYGHFCHLLFFVYGNPRNTPRINL